LFHLSKQNKIIAERTHYDVELVVKINNNMTKKKIVC
jgi:hypothetical protein